MMSARDGFVFCAVAVAVAACGSDGEGDSPGAQGDSGEITWHGHIAPLVTEKCIGCHTDGGVAPFSFERYEDALPNAAVIATETERGTMPPFLAQETEDCVPRHG